MRRLRYENGAGDVVLVEVPWDDGSGNIPPPTITFNGPADTFVYVGDTA